MSKVRVLVGTRKGAFILTSDAKRERWNVAGPHFGGWEMYHLKGSPAEPNRIYASDRQAGLASLSSALTMAAKPGSRWATSSCYLGTISGMTARFTPGNSNGSGYLVRLLTDPDTVYAGVEDAALFRSTDAGQNWQEFPGLRGHGSGPHWQPGAGGMCLHTVILDPQDPARIYIAISAAGAFRTDDGGATWRPINRGLKSGTMPDPTAEVGH